MGCFCLFLLSLCSCIGQNNKSYLLQTYTRITELNLSMHDIAIALLDPYEDATNRKSIFQQKLEEVSVLLDTMYVPNNGLPIHSAALDYVSTYKVLLESEYLQTVEHYNAYQQTSADQLNMVLKQKALFVGVDTLQRNFRRACTVFALQEGVGELGMLKDKQEGYHLHLLNVQEVELRLAMLSQKFINALNQRNIHEMGVACDTLNRFCESVMMTFDDDYKVSSISRWLKRYVESMCELSDFYFPKLMEVLSLDDITDEQQVAFNDIIHRMNFVAVEVNATSRKIQIEYLRAYKATDGALNE